MNWNLKKYIKLRGVQILALGFVVIILIGTILLTLPISTASGESTSFLDALFTATSAVCVTGLIVVDTGSYWNMFGQTIIMILIEIGGLGFMSFTTLIAIILGKKITLRERLILQDAMNTFNIQGLVKMVKYVLVFTVSVQFFGALLLSTQFIPEFGFGKGAFYSLFHSISAFCNAGFDLFGNSLFFYQTNIIVILTISILIIIGGLGFTVLVDIYNYNNSTRLYTHTKFVLSITTILLVVGTCFILFMEYDNPNTLGNMKFGYKLLNSFFASVSSRTAGFYSISLPNLTTGSIFLYFILMFIGGSSIGTAGGIKTTTVATLFLSTRAIVKGKTHLVVFRKNIPHQTVTKALAVTMVSISFLLLASVGLYQAEGGSMVDVVYETTSALATVGLTRDYTSKLHLLGKLIIIVCMYLGRIGPISMVIFFNKERKKDLVSFPHEDINVG